MAVTPVDQEERDVAVEGPRRGFWFEQLLRDIRYSVRSLLRAPGFTLAVITTLALCIGANTAIFSTLYSLMLKPLPFRDPGQLVEIYSTFPKSPFPRGGGNIAQYLAYKESADLVEAVSLAFPLRLNFGEDSDPERISCARVTTDFFRVLGVNPLHGAFFTSEQSTPGQDKVVVLTQTFWETHFRSDPAIVGQPIKLSGEQYTVMGIAPRSVEAVNVTFVIFKPFEYQPPTRGGGPGGTMFARLKPGVPHGQALAQIDTIEKQLFEKADPGFRAFVEKNGFKMALGPLRAEQASVVRTGLLSLQGAVLFVLLIGCINVANLMLARSNTRMGEFAIRQALGAGRGVLARQLLVDAFLLTLAGAVLGVLLASSGLSVINRHLAEIAAYAGPISLDRTILGATALGSLLVALVIGLTPVWRLLIGLRGAEDIGALMQAGSLRTSRSRKARAAAAVLTTGQVAIALILLVGAGLLIRSFANVLALDPGFDVDRVFMGRTGLPMASLRDPQMVWEFQDRVVEKMREIPGVEKVSLSPNPFMYSGNSPIAAYFLPGMTIEPGVVPPLTNLLYVMPDFFSTMGIPLLEGRDFNADDKRGSRVALIIDRTLAERAFPGQSAVGQRISFSGPPRNDADWPLVVGVVGDARLRGLEGQNDFPFAYGSAKQSGASNGVSIVLRTSEARADMAPLVRAKVREADPSLPFYMFGTMQSMIDDLLANRRGMVLLLSALAVLALVLSAVGIYGTLAYDVSQRTREIGIRGAMGATRAQIVGLILRQGLWRTVIGLAVGLVGAFFLTRFLSSLLYEIEPADPLAYALVSALLLVVALAASYLPARRAAKVNPVEALRCE
jgi:predicted permease